MRDVKKRSQAAFDWRIFSDETFNAACTALNYLKKILEGRFVFPGIT